MEINTTMSVRDQLEVQNAVNLQNTKNTAETGKVSSSRYRNAAKHILP